jgi:hypothetical protein
MKKVAITNKLIATALHSLDELNLSYVVLIEDVPQVFSNVSPLHAAAIISNQCQRDEKIKELKIEQDAERATAIPDES